MNIVKITFSALALILSGHIALAATPFELDSAGTRPQFGDELCKRLNDASPIAVSQNSKDDLFLRKILPVSQKEYTSGMLNLVGDEVIWWLRSVKINNVASVGQSFHEANHTLDFAISRCLNSQIAYYYQGSILKIDLRRGDTPPFAIAAEYIPQLLKQNPLGRFNTYFVRTKPLQSNDFTMLLEEFNAYFNSGRLELAFAGSPLYARSKMNGEMIDGNIGGTTDFMLYTIYYLRATREKYPAMYARIRESKSTITFLQELWTASEKLLADAKENVSYRGGIFVIPKSTLDLIYDSENLQEMDRIGVRHKKLAPW